MKWWWWLWWWGPSILISSAALSWLLVPDQGFHLLTNTRGIQWTSTQVGVCSCSTEGDNGLPMILTFKTNKKRYLKKDDSHEQHRRGATSCPCSTGSPLPSPPPTVLAQLAGCTRQRYGEVTADSYLARWHQHLDEKDNDKDNDNDNGGLYKAAIWRGDCW